MAEFFTNVSNFFSWISEVLLSFFDYFISLMESLLVGIGVLSQSMTWATGIIGYMPVVVGSSLVAVLFIYALKFIIGR